MEAYVERMINEHKELIEKMSKLGSWIGNPQNNDNKIEFALKYTQYNAMRIYEEALRNRLALAGITVANGRYFEQPVNTEETKEETKEETNENS